MNYATADLLTQRNEMTIKEETKASKSKRVRYAEDKAIVKKLFSTRLDGKNRAIKGPNLIIQTNPQQKRRLVKIEQQPVTKSKSPT